MIKVVENANGNLLYHNTSVYSLSKILSDNKLAGLTTHKGDFWIDGESKSGISLTRNYNYMEDCTNAKFIFKREVLSRRYKILPFTRVQSLKARTSKVLSFRNASEEFLIGDIDNLFKVTLSIVVDEWEYSQCEPVPSKWKSKLVLLDKRELY